MIEHQDRIISRLMESMNGFLQKKTSLVGIQKDLEAYSMSVDSVCLQNSIWIASNKLDECIHFYDEDEGIALGAVIIKELMIDVDKYVNS